MMDNKHVGFEINLKEGEKIVHVPLSKELNKKFAKRYENKKTADDYIREFLIKKVVYDKVIKIVNQQMEEALPLDIKDKCKYCKGESEDIGDKACAKYFLQMKMTYHIAIHEFVSIIVRHRHIHNNKQTLCELTLNFFNCLHFAKGKGAMYFDLDKIRRFTLNAGFLSLAEMFKSMEENTRLNFLNRTIDDINDKIIENETLLHEDENYLDLQKRFFEGKLRFYKDEIFINGINNNNNNNNLKATKGNNSKRKKISIPKYALYYYYLQESGDFGYFENHPNGKLAAITELIEKEGIKTTTNYFQKEYNFIAHHRTNRVAQNKVSHIDFVANTMLKDFEKAKLIALSELKEAKTKNR